MKKTNIRIKSYFIFEDKNEYFLSSISDIQQWKDLKEDDFNEIKGEDVSIKLKKLMKEYDIYTNVNLYDGDETTTIKKIEFEKKGG